MRLDSRFAAALAVLTFFLTRPENTPVIKSVQISSEVSQNRTNYNYKEAVSDKHP